MVGILARERYWRGKMTNKMTRREPWLNILLFLSRPFTRYSAFTRAYDMIKKCHRGNRASSGRVVERESGKKTRRETCQAERGRNATLNQASCSPPFNLVRTTTVKVDTDMNIFEDYGTSRTLQKRDFDCKIERLERQPVLQSRARASNSLLPLTVVVVVNKDKW